MEKKLSPIYRRNQGPDPNYSSPLAQIAKDLDEEKNKTIPGQSLNESVHVRQEAEPHISKHAAGPKQGDLVRGPHLKYGSEGFPMDYDYYVEFEKDTTDKHGDYKIWKTTGIK